MSMGRRSIREPSRPEPLRPNRSNINAHLFALFSPDFVKDHPGAQIEIAFASPKTDDDGPDAAENFSVFDLQKAVDFAERKSKAGFNVYVGAALRNARVNRQGQQARRRHRIPRLGRLR